MMKNNIQVLMFTVMLVILSGCNAGKEESGKLSVFVSILPQKYFVERIGGSRVIVDVMVKPGQSPETYEPSPDQIVKLGSSSVFFTIGVPFETRLVPSIRDSVKKLVIADTSEGVVKRVFESYDSHDNEDSHDELPENAGSPEKNGGRIEDDGHSHEAGVTDPHIWLSPVAVKIQAENIFRYLSEADPDGKDYYSKNLENFLADLDKAHSHLKEALAPYHGKTIFVFHPAFGYFTDEYGLRQESIETGGKDPAPATLMKIIDRALSEQVKIIFVQPEFPEKSASAVAEAIGGAVVELNPLDPDYINNLEHIASEIEKALLK